MTLSEVCATIALFCQVPQTLWAVIQLLKRKEPDFEAAARKLEELRCQVRDFCRVHSWLREAKDLHDHLSNLHIALRIPVEQSRTFLAQRGNLEAMRLGNIADIWRAVSGYHLGKLLGFAESISEVEKVPLETGEALDFKTGPKWARDVLAAKKAIDDALARHASGKADIKHHRILADSLDALDATLTSQMGRINEAIRKVAGELERALREVKGSLSNEPV